MDWKQLLHDLVDHGMTLQAIADKTGISSRGHVLNIKTGRQATVSYDVGCKLVALHKKVMHRKQAA